MRFRKHIVFLISFLSVEYLLAQPAITSFSPTSGPIGTTVIINGVNFNSTPGNNIVFFGAVKANVLAATNSLLTVTVPAGASYQPISVTTNNLTAYSNRPFVVTFPNGGTPFNIASFAAKKDFQTGNWPGQVSIGDLDGDGKPDLLSTNDSSIGMSIFRNLSTPGNILLDTTVHDTLPKGSRGHALTDFNGDGRLDLALVNIYSKKLSALKNTGPIGIGSFFPKFDFLTGAQPVDVFTGDLNGDGKPDAVTANVSSGGISVFRNTGTSATIWFGAIFHVNTGNGPLSNPISVSIGDLDGDNKADVVVANWVSLTISILRNTSTTSAITFAPKVDFYCGEHPNSVTIGDLDMDGKPDIAVANSLGNTVSVFRNICSNGIISFEPKMDFVTGNYAAGVSIGDLDGDSKPDLAVANSYSGTVSVFKNNCTNGVISFTPKTDYATGAGPYKVSIGDVDGDGKPDLVTANANDHTISILRNQVGESNIICEGESTFTSNINGSTYQWQQSTDSVVFTSISDNTYFSGTNTNTLRLSNIPASWHGYAYRVVVDGNISSLFYVNFNNTWIGSNTAWEDAANWSCGRVPDKNTDVIINSGTVVLNSNATIRSLKLKPGVTFTVSPGYTLTITH